jgi:type VI secretion system protein ImpG
LNYLSLVDTDAEEGAAALRQMLMLYGDRSNAQIQRQIQGLKSITTTPIIRRATTFSKTIRPTPISFGRGLEVVVEFEEAAFEGSSVSLLGAVLEEFFSKYVSLNSFTETVIKTIERGEIKRWPTRMGSRNLA